MTRRVLIPLLALAAVAVTIQNVLFFSGRGGGAALLAEEGGDADEAEDPMDELFEREPDAQRPVLPLFSVQLQDWLVSLRVAGDVERNPFLTRAEEEHLRGGPGAAAVGGSGASRPWVTGTLWSRQRRVAWVNGRPRVEGEQVGDARIVRIERDQVVMRREGKELRIPVSSGPRPMGQEDR